MKLAVTCLHLGDVDSSHFKIYLYLSASCSDLKNFVYMCLYMYVCLLYALCIRICVNFINSGKCKYGKYWFLSKGVENTNVSIQLCRSTLSFEGGSMKIECNA